MDERRADDGASTRSGDGPTTPARVVALINQKGGVGKTTTAVNLSAALAMRGRRTLLVDLDPQAHATLHLGVEAGAGSTLYELLLGERGVGDVLVSAREGLDLLPAGVDMAALEGELSGESDRYGRLGAALEGLRGAHEFVILDCPPSLGLLTLNGLSAAREVIVPMQAHYLALQGLGKLLETVSLVGRGVNPKLRVSGVVLCAHEEQTRHAREVVEDLERFFESSRDRGLAWSGAGVYRPPIRRNIKLAEAPSFGQTIFEYARWCPGAMDYGKLAETLLKQWDRYLAKRFGGDAGESGGGARPTVEVVHPRAREAAG